MIIIGHRGAAGLAPENTLASFEAALQIGVDWIEFDVRTTRDGHVVLSHDSHTLRTGLRPHIISRTTFEKLQQVKLRGGNTIPTVAQAFKTIGDKAKINVEIKTHGCAQAVVKQIADAIANGRKYDDFMVSSFKVSVLREVHHLDGKIPLALLHAINPYKFLHLRGLRVQAVGFSYKYLPARAVHQAELRELFVYVYTVNNPATAARLAEDRNVKAVVTNRPDRMQGIRD
ncbi:MAG TPA: glycerophosphodiester phosphodiesterase [Candidatus Saccharimonas sp.]|nr:glycerophosphodiester phosphodiesterase [Candidatus Saccharimonas sp.]